MPPSILHSVAAQPHGLPSWQPQVHEDALARSALSV